MVMRFTFSGCTRVLCCPPALNISILAALFSGHRAWVSLRVLYFKLSDSQSF